MKPSKELERKNALFETKQEEWGDFDDWTDEQNEEFEREVAKLGKRRSWKVKRSRPRRDVVKGELVARRAADLEVPARIVIPETIEEAKSYLVSFNKLETASKWGTAALVYAYTYDTGGGRPSQKMANSRHFRGQLTIGEFAKRGIRGLTTRDTVRRYRQAWEKAIEERLVKPVKPGVEVVLPGKPFPTVFGTYGAPDPEEAARQVRKRNAWHITMTIKAWEGRTLDRDLEHTLRQAAQRIIDDDR
jgi:hypothetical protein